MSKYAQEWEYRKAVMEAIMIVLQDGKPRTALQLLGSLPYDDGLKANKKLVNSILYSEAKRYVIRDNNSFTWHLRPGNELPPLRAPWDLVRSQISELVRAYGSLSVDEIIDELEIGGIPAPKWMVKAIVGKDEFRVTLPAEDVESAWIEKEEVVDSKKPFSPDTSMDSVWLDTPNKDKIDKLLAEIADSW